jgi:hypothetical protein
MALDDGGAQIDPATLPENAGLIAEIDAQLAAAEAERAHRRDLGARLACVVPEAAAAIEKRVTDRSGSTAREEDLRGGIADALRSRGELVMTEPKLAVPGWTANLGGFDLAIVAENALVVGETKWADGNLYECMWDIFKLAASLQIPRVEAAVAIYGAPTKHWARPESCARLFEDRQILPGELILGLPEEWAANLAGSSAQPNAVPMQIQLTLLGATAVSIFGKEWAIRAVSVTGHPRSLTLSNGWPAGAPPASPKPYVW